MSGRVVALFVRPERHARDVPRLEEVRVTPRGIRGDVHEGRSNRSVLLVDAGDLGELALDPGDLREQITLDLPGLMTLAPGTRLEMGDAVLEITKVCAPCTHIGEHVGVEDVEAFRDTLEGRRGMLARVASVVGDGVVRVGDAVRVLARAQRA